MVLKAQVVQIQVIVHLMDHLVKVEIIILLNQVAVAATMVVQQVIVVAAVLVT